MISLTMNKNKITVILFVLSLAFTMTVLAEEMDARAIFDKGNSFYVNGDFDAAISEYKKIEDTGYVSGNLYYNMGNCYFKKDDPGQALLYYERALKLMPRDSDLKSNYRYALSSSDSRSIEDTMNFPRIVFKIMFGGFTTNQIYVSLSFCYWIIILMLILRMFYTRFRKTGVIILAGCFIYLLLGGYEAFYRSGREGKEYIAVKNNMQVKFAPFENATNFFTLHTGEKVLLSDSSGAWVKIKRDDNKSGWVQKDSIKRI